MASDTYWSNYYSEVTQRGEGWLDYSNPAVQAQTLALCLESAGQIHGHPCLDVGCGRGQLAAMLRDLGGAPVIGVDFIEALVEEDRARFPGIDFRHGDACDETFLATLPPMDRIFAVEVLQCLEAATVLPRLWERLGPGGRLVCMVPHAPCPIVRRVRERMADRYHALDVAGAAAIAARLEGLSDWLVRGLTFGEDQRVAPYRTSAWGHDVQGVPNRLNLVFLKN
ncbi:class I SAM-dependent methyltransferase [Marinimicrococcus flavescens]|uniref:Class I SAM-dependent methyltransferase n=1 Tax=Marinimicrococcus flavescens TaxID=3031815 RepID=A0AAP3XRD6_9PROT|nr:class I SAM-dependent methyltransferase [Marinimicrococcus flavescens]